MRTSKTPPRHSLTFGLFLAVVGALLLLAALAPGANAGSTDYWDSEYPLSLSLGPAPELLSPQGAQPLASIYNPDLALNVASGGQFGGFQPFQVDTNFSWTGATSSIWNIPGNWSPSGPPGAADVALFDGSFSNQPTVTNETTVVGELHMATGIAQNVTIFDTAANILTIKGVGGIGILIDNASAFTLSIAARIGLDASQTWTNNSGNLFTVRGTTLGLGEDNILTVNGTGNTLISAVTDGAGRGSTIIKDGSGTLTMTAHNAYSGGTIVNGGTLLVNLSGDLGDKDVTVNNSGTLGGNSTAQINSHVTVNAGGNLAPGNGGNNTAVLTLNALTLQPASNFRIDINGIVAGAGYDQLQVNAGVGERGVIITDSNLLVHVGTTLAVGQTFLILHHFRGFTGEFAQGSTVVGDNGSVFSVSYSGGDIILTVTSAVPEPSTWIGGALAIAGIAFTQRRRLRKFKVRLARPQ